MIAFTFCIKKWFPAASRSNQKENAVSVLDPNMKHIQSLNVIRKNAILYFFSGCIFAVMYFFKLLNFSYLKFMFPDSVSRDGRRPASGAAVPSLWPLHWHCGCPCIGS